MLEYALSKCNEHESYGRVNVYAVLTDKRGRILAENGEPVQQISPCCTEICHKDRTKRTQELSTCRNQDVTGLHRTTQTFEIVCCFYGQKWEYSLCFSLQDVLCLHQGHRTTIVYQNRDHQHGRRIECTTKDKKSGL